MDRAVALAYGWGDLDLGHGFHQTIAAHALHHQRGGARRGAGAEAFGSITSAMPQRSGKGLHETGRKGKQGRAARASDGDEARQEATVLPPGLFNEEV